MIDYDLIVVDEASMLPLWLFERLVSYGVPLLLVGDHGQLPPVSDGNEPDVGIMDDPDVRLEKIHRQAETNEIIATTRYIRENGGLPADLKDSEHIRVVDERQAQELLRKLYATEQLEDIATLVHANWERKLWNQHARNARGLSGSSIVRGDQVICLRNRNGILFNGMRGVVESDPVDRDLWASAKFYFPDDDLDVSGWMLKEQLSKERERTFSNPLEVEEATGFRPKPFERAGLLLDYGYALTVHKMQGSQAKHIFFSPRGSKHMGEQEYTRWCYTGASRAISNLYILR